jgi:hypothetical protein
VKLFVRKTPPASGDGVHGSPVYDNSLNAVVAGEKRARAELLQGGVDRLSWLAGPETVDEIPAVGDVLPVKGDA